MFGTLGDVELERLRDGSLLGQFPGLYALLIK